MTHSRNPPQRAKLAAAAALDSAQSAAAAALSLEAVPDQKRLGEARRALAAAYAAATAARAAAHACRYHAAPGMPPSVAARSALSRDAARYAAQSAAKDAIAAARDLEIVIANVPPLHVPDYLPPADPIRLAFDVDPRPAHVEPTAHDLELDARWNSMELPQHIKDQLDRSDLKRSHVDAWAPDEAIEARRARQRAYVNAKRAKARQLKKIAT